MKGHQSINMNELDKKLDGPSQQVIARAVSAMPEEDLSMAWRSQLNSQILAVAEAQVKRKRQLNIFWRPAFGLGLAGAIAAVVLFRPSASTPVTAPSIEGAIVQHHREYVGTYDLVSYGLSPIDARATGTVASPSPEWNESDLESF